MSNAINATSGHSTFLLSDKRVGHMLSGDRKTATHMGVWDKFKDLFRTEKKEAALNCLFALLNGNTSSDHFHRFNKLSMMASESNRLIFTVDVASGSGQDPDGSRVSYCINGQAVKTYDVTSYDREVIMTKLGQPLDTQTLHTEMALLDCCERNTDSEIKKLTNADFKSGGVNKQFAPKVGVLKSCNSVGNNDFALEGELRNYAKDFLAMSSYSSMQQKITAPENVDPNFEYAKVTRYDESKVTSSEFSECLGRLTEEQIMSVAVQIVDMEKEKYKAKVSHGDPHGDNLLLITRLKDNAVFLKAIDWGHAKFGEDFKGVSLRDIDYIFNRQARSQIETLSRNYLRSEDSEKMKKHYPLHKLLEKAGGSPEAVAETLSGIGKMLKADLQIAGTEEQRINQAFARASASVQMALNSLLHPKLSLRYKTV